MNKKLSIFAICLFVSCCFAYGFQFKASALTAGDIIGEAASTNILAHINNYPINSYNIDGYTYVRAEDLENYGFDITWNADERKLYLNRNKDKEIVGMNAGDILIPKMSVVPGEKVFDLYYTDIITYLNSNEIKSYNIDGSTVICMEDLESCGELKWLGYSRDLRLTIPAVPKEDAKLLIETDAQIKELAINYLNANKKKLYLYELLLNENFELTNKNVTINEACLLNDFQMEVTIITEVIYGNQTQYLYRYLLFEKKDGQWSISDACELNPPDDWNKKVYTDFAKDYYNNSFKDVSGIFVAFVDYISPYDSIVTLSFNTKIGDNEKEWNMVRLNIAKDENGHLYAKSDYKLSTFKNLKYDDIGLGEGVLFRRRKIIRV